MATTRMLGIVCAALTVVSCCKEPGGSGDTPGPEPVLPTTTVPGATLGGSDTPAAPPGAATDPNRPGRGLDGLPAEIPPPGSKPPSVAEWNDAPWEITVSRSTPLGCETKMVREWLRVSCRGENKDGGKIMGLTIMQKGGVQAYELQREGLASLVVQVVKGKKHVTRFRWTDRMQNLVVDWTDLGPRPTIQFTD